jgi:hypothetical protein
MKEKISSVISSVPMKEKISSVISSVPMKEKISSVISSVPMKGKIITAISSIPLIAATTMSSSCATSCPYGMVNDPFPGQCSRYLDISGDGICDLSQVTAAATTDTSTTDTSSTVDAQTTTISDHGNGNGGSFDTVTPSDDANATVVHDTSGLDTGNMNDPTNYYVLPVSIMLLAGYLFTHYLFQKGILKRTKHRKIWNLLVTAGYLGTGVTGVFLTLMINLGIRTALNPTITFWHAELAILMVIGTMIHIHLYRKPFKNMFGVLFGGFKFNIKKTIQGKINSGKILLKGTGL